MTRHDANGRSSTTVPIGNDLINNCNTNSSEGPEAKARERMSTAVANRPPMANFARFIIALLERACLMPTAGL